MPEDNGLLGTVARDEGNKHKTSVHDTKMDLDVANIDKMIRIHGGPHARQLMKVTLDRFNYFPEHLSIFVKNIQRSHKTFQLISRRIKKISLSIRMPVRRMPD